MTLKEKFDKVMEYPFSEYKEQMKVLKEENSIEYLKIADEFAIGFAEHIQNIGFNKLTQKGYDNKTIMWFSDTKGIGVTTNELLESYRRNL
jgi:hypothetical protein